MLLNFIFSVYFLNFVVAQWEPASNMAPPHVSRPGGSDGVTAFSMKQHHMDLVKQVPPMFEIINQNPRCHTMTTMMKMIQRVLAYLTENPNKIEHLHHIVKYITDDHGNSNHLSNRIAEAISLIERDKKLSSREKTTLRDLLRLDQPISDMKTTIVFKYELPSVNHPHCKNVFMKLMEVAHNIYMKFAQNSRCEPTSNDNYDNSNQNQPKLPPGEPDRENFNNFPGFDGVPWNGNDDGRIEEYITDLLPDWNKPPRKDNSHENEKYIVPENNRPEHDKDPVPYLPEHVTPSNTNINNNEIDRIILLLTQYQNSNPDPNIYEYILSIAKLLQNGSSDSKIYSLVVELLNSKIQIGPQNPKLVELILILLSRNQNYVPSPEIIQILTPFLKPNESGEVDPKMIELIVVLLKLSKNMPSTQRYQVLISLLNPSENPKIIEIITYLLNVNDNSLPNYKVIYTLMSFLKLNLYSINAEHIDQLLYLLKLNNNHHLPVQLYYQIIQFLLKFNASKNDSTFNQFPFSNSDGNPQMNSKGILTLLLIQNPYLFGKLLPKQNGGMPNQLGYNTQAIIELTYLLKQLTPYVYQPVHYIKYRMPLQTFLINLRNILSKNPQLSGNPTKLYQKLITISNVSDVSPNLKGYSKEDVLNMTYNSGVLTTAKIIDHNNLQFLEQLKLTQNMNSDVQPDVILKQKERMLGDFDDQRHKLDGYWDVMQAHNTLPQNGHVAKVTLPKSPYHVWQSSNSYIPLSNTFHHNKYPNEIP